MDFKMIFQEIDRALDLKINEVEQNIPLQIIEDDGTIKLKIDEVYRMTDVEGLSIYDRAYEVTPKVECQSLETNQKFMTDDVTINAIPIYEVSNNAGGQTVYIGKELE